MPISFTGKTDAEQQYIQFTPTEIASQTLTEFTASFRMLVTDNIDANCNIMSQVDAAPRNPWRMIKQGTTPGEFGTIAAFNGTSGQVVGGNYTVPVDEVFVITFTYSTANGFRIYVNGVLARSNSNSSGVDFTGDPWRFGSIPGNISQRGDWTLFEFIFGEKEMTADEVLSMNDRYLASVRGFPYMYRFNFEDKTTGAVTDGDAVLDNHELVNNSAYVTGARSMTIGAGTPDYSAAANTQVPLADPALYTGFVMTETKSSGNKAVARNFYNKPANFFTIADSYSVGLSNARWGVGIWRSLQPKKGWSGIHLPSGLLAGTPPDFEGFKSSTFNSQDNLFTDIAPTEEIAGTGDYWSMPFYVSEIALSTSNLLVNSTNIYRYVPTTLTGGGGEPGDRTNDLIFANNVDNDDRGAGVILYKKPTLDYVVSYGQRNTNSGTTTLVNVSLQPDGFSYAEYLGTFTETGGYPNEGTYRITTTPDWEGASLTGSTYFHWCGVRMYRKDLTGHELFLTHADNSWSLWGHENLPDDESVGTLPNSAAADKRSKYSEIVNYFEATPTDRQTIPFYPMLCIRQESLTRAETKTRIENIYLKYKEAIEEASMVWGGMFLTMNWPDSAGLLSTNTDYAAAMYALSQLYDDIYFVNLYGIMEGVIPDGTDTVDQTAVMKKLGLGPVKYFFSGLEDFSTKDMLDGTSAYHQADNESAFAFGYMWSRQIQRDGGLAGGGGGLSLGLRLNLNASASSALSVRQFSDGIVIAGQSNAVGQGAEDDAPVAYQTPFAGSKIFTSSGTITDLTTATAEGDDTDEFGVDIPFSRAYAEGTAANTVIKTGANGTSLAVDWKPTVPYGTALQNALDQIDAAVDAGIQPKCVLWVHGEADAADSAQAAAYGTNLTTLITLFRDRYGADLPFVIAKLRPEAPYTYVTDVRDDQQSVADTLANVYAVETAGQLTVGDNVHYNAGALINIGQAMYEALDTQSDLFAGPAFISTWDTENTSVGSSNSDQVTLPLMSSGVYYMEVDWGDGNTDVITAYNDAAVTHTYASAGEYDISIKGRFRGLQFNNTGDKEKILDIQQWGLFQFDNNGSAQFRGCVNMDITASEAPDASLVVSFASGFRDCSSLVGANWTEPWNLSSCTNTTFMFSGCSLFEGDVSGWDVSLVEQFDSMFINCTVFNTDISGWDTSSALDFTNMLRSCPAFDQNLAAWDVSSVADMTSMFQSSTLSTANYSNTLIGWAAQSVQANVPFHGGNSTYNPAGLVARNTLNGAPNNWTITDGGAA